LTGPDLHRLDFFERFHLLISDPPLPRFSQRDTSSLFSLDIFTSSVWVVSDFLVHRHAAKSILAQQSLEYEAQCLDCVDAGQRSQP
jgi:hypothetical protein